MAIEIHRRKRDFSETEEQGNEPLLKKALICVRHLNSEELAQLCKALFDRFRQLNPSWDVHYSRIKGNQYFWIMRENRLEHKAKHYGFIEDNFPYPSERREAVMIAVEKAEGRQRPYASYNLDEGLLERQGYASLGTEAKYYLEGMRKKERIEQLKAKPKPKTQEASKMEFAYRWDWDWDWTGMSHKNIIKYQIVKKTKKLIWINREPYRPGSNDGYWTRCFIFNRHVFENFNSVWSESAGAHFYKNENIMLAEGLKSSETDLNKLFGIEGEMTLDKLKAAYRKKCKELHPDHGGDKERFVKMHEVYEGLRKTLAGKGEEDPFSKRTKI